VPSILHPASCILLAKRKQKEKSERRRRRRRRRNGMGGGSVGGPVTALGWHKCAHGARQKVSWQEPGLPKRK